MSADFEKLVKAYVNIRDARSELRRNFDAADNDLKEGLAKVEAFLLNHLNENSIDSVRTGAGTFYRQEDLTPSASDWSAVYSWIRENDAFDALERRLKKTFIKDYMDEHDGDPPPGVSVFREFVVRVRRA